MKFSFDASSDVLLAVYNGMLFSFVRTNSKDPIFPLDGTHEGLGAHRWLKATVHSRSLAKTILSGLAISQGTRVLITCSR
jgi:hypothetical protein